MWKEKLALASALFSLVLSVTLAILFWTAFCWRVHAAPVATNIGTNNGGPVTTLAVTVPAGGVPAGALIVVCVADNSVSIVGGSVADTASNTYTPLVGADNNNNTANGFGRMFYAFNAAALVSGNSITYTLAIAAQKAAVTAFYVTGIQAGSDPSEASAAATGTSASPSVTSGTPAGTADFFVGCVSVAGGSGDAFTQDATNAAWATPPVRVGVAGGTNPTIAGGSVQGPGTSTRTYAPAITSRVWADMIGAFKVATASSRMGLTGAGH